jgi:hypothetical protein
VNYNDSDDETIALAAQIGLSVRRFGGVAALIEERPSSRMSPARVSSV